jgi:hypothetical protein
MAGSTVELLEISGSREPEALGTCASTQPVGLAPPAAVGEADDSGDDEQAALISAIASAPSRLVTADLDMSRPSEKRGESTGASDPLSRHR